MELSKKQFFETAIDVLFKERGQGECTYRQAIDKAVKKYGMSYEELKKLCSSENESIVI